MAGADLKVAIVFYNIGPYHHARLNAAAQFCRVLGIEWSGQNTFAWGESVAPARYEKISLLPDASGRRHDSKILYQVLCRALDQAVPDVVAVNGWNDFGSAMTLNCSTARRIPTILMSESSARDEPRTFWKEWIKRRVVDLYSTALVGGQRHVDYLVDLGMPRERIFTGYDVVDNAYFAQGAKEARDQRSEVRSQHRLPENYFLASARFIPKKNLFALLRAYEAYVRRCERENVGKWNLVLLGDGPLKTDLCRLISDLRLDACVHLPGFKQYDELPVYYALANAFVHASTTEQWGLVVNEAIACGLPVIVSNRCGCVPELVRDNGYSFNPADLDELASRLFEMATLSDEERERLGNASCRIAADFAPARFGEGLECAAKVAVELGRRKPTLFQRALLHALVRR